MSDPNTSPVSIPAGSFDEDALKRSLEKAAKGSDKNYSTAVEKALEESSASAHTSPDPRGQPGYVFKEVEHPELGVKETIQVYDPKEGAKIEDDAGSAILAPQATTPAPKAPAAKEN